MHIKNFKANNKISEPDYLFIKNKFLEVRHQQVKFRIERQ